MADSEDGLTQGIELFLDEILRSVEAGTYLLALLGALTIPDVMAALSSEDGESNGDRYRAWFDENARDYFTVRGPMFRRIDPKLEALIKKMPEALWKGSETDVFTGEECWRFRCSMLHQGKTGHEKGLARVVFVEPGSNNTFHMNVMTQGGRRILNIDLPIFCQSMVEAARTWLGNHIDDEVVQTNLSDIVRRYPKGFGGIGGVPVIA